MQIRGQQRSGTHKFFDTRTNHPLIELTAEVCMILYSWKGWTRQSTMVGGTSIAPISLRKFSENYISPSGKYLTFRGNFCFSFVPSPTDTCNTGADIQR